MASILQLHRTVVINAPACAGIGCRRGDYPHLCDCELSNSVPLSTEFPTPPERTDEDDHARAIFWQSYVYSVIGIAVTVTIFACWPK